QAGAEVPVPGGRNVEVHRDAVTWRGPAATAAAQEGLLAVGEVKAAAVRLDAEHRADAARHLGGRDTGAVGGGVPVDELVAVDIAGRGNPGVEGIGLFGRRISGLVHRLG